MAKGQYVRKKHFTYTVYDNRKSYPCPVIIGKPARECAAAMGISLGSFRTIYTKLKNGSKGATQKWDIFRDDPEEDDTHGDEA